MSSSDATRRSPARALTRILGLGLILTLLMSLLQFATPTPTPAEAANGSEFNPGNIISDATFYNSTAMSVTEIQSFLNGKVASCISGYTCLKDYQMTTPNRAASAYCSAYTGVANQSAASIIHAVGLACGINPQVLLVLLQKEQGLITARSPSAGKYQSATGFACPDTAPCDAEYYGFFNQVYSAARQYKVYQAFPGSFGYRAGRVNTILWHPNRDCGTSEVYIENQATAGLYIYTPYRPNAAALANVGGLGDACSSYGNRNFWAYFTDWFGLVAGPPPTVTANVSLGEPDSYLLARDAAGAMTLHPSDGAGNVTTGGNVGTGWLSMNPVFSVGDFDGDGKADVIARDGAGALWLYPRNGLGGWSPRKLIGTSWHNFTTIFDAGDYNGDGNPDVMARDGAGALWVYPGNGSGGWLPRLAAGTSWDQFTSVFGVGDFSGDGNDDVLTRDAAGGLHLYRGNGNGGWILPRVTVGTSWQSFAAVFAAGDFDGDGNPDVFAKDSSGGLFLYRGNGNGGWILPRTQVAGNWQAQSPIIPIADTGGTGAPTPTPTPTTPAPTPTPTPTPTVAPPGGTPSAPIGDFTSDGIRDLIARDITGAISIYPGNGSGGTLPPIAAPIGATYTTMLLPGDFSGDGKQDLMGLDTGGALWLHAGDGIGGWQPRVQVGSSWQSFTSVFAAGDFNGDGKPDIMARDAAGNLWLYPGNGASGWLARVRVGTSWHVFTALLSPGDFTGDGYPDVLARDSAGALWTYAGDGRGGWKLPRTAAGTSWHTLVSLNPAGDFSGDGKQDILARDSTGRLLIYKGNGSGWWNLPAVIMDDSWKAFTWIG